WPLKPVDSYEDIPKPMVAQLLTFVKTQSAPAKDETRKKAAILAMYNRIVKKNPDVQTITRAMVDDTTKGQKRDAVARSLFIEGTQLRAVGRYEKETTWVFDPKTGTQSPQTRYVHYIGKQATGRMPAKLFKAELLKLSFYDDGPLKGKPF